MYKYGDIILFKPIGLYGKAITFVDGSPISHIGVFWKYEKGIPLFFESHEKKGGFVISKLHEWGNYEVRRPKKHLKIRPVKEVLNKVGTEYDKWLIIDILLNKLSKDTVYNNNENHFICSELADYIFYYKVGNGKLATPKTFYISNEFEKINE